MTPYRALPVTLLLLLCGLIVGSGAGCQKLEEFEDELNAPDLDCSVRDSHSSNPNWKCTRASSYRGRCIPAADFQKWSCLELDTNAEFCRDDKPFKLSVYLTHSGVALDCQDQLIDHTEKPANRTAAIRAPYEQSVSDISISHCRIRGGTYAVDLKRYFRGEELSGPMQGHARISLKDLQISGTSRFAVYVGQNTEEFSLTDSSIADSFAGIYLEAGSSHATIARSVIRGSQGREAIAADSTRFNLVEDMVFSGNGQAINFYKNCGEVRGQVCPIVRKWGSSDNTVRRSVFDGDDVTVASRLFERYGPNECDGSRFTGVWQDHASDNRFEHNRFENNARLTVQDGPIFVEDNDFTRGSLKIGKEAPTFKSPREISGLIANNRLMDDFLFGTIYGLHDLAFENNRDIDGACASVPNRCH